MSENLRFVCSMVFAVVGTFVTSYWTMTVNNATLEANIQSQFQAVEKDIVLIKRDMSLMNELNTQQSLAIQANMLSAAQASEILKTVVKTLSKFDETVDDLKEVVVRLDERVNHKQD